MELASEINKEKPTLDNQILQILSQYPSASLELMYIITQSPKRTIAERLLALQKQKVIKCVYAGYVRYYAKNGGEGKKK